MERWRGGEEERRQTARRLEGWLVRWLERWLDRRAVECLGPALSILPPALDECLLVGALMVKQPVNAQARPACAVRGGAVVACTVTAVKTRQLRTRLTRATEAMPGRPVGRPPSPGNIEPPRAASRRAPRRRRS